MNKMAEFAKLLEKELDEEFIVKAEADDYKCKLTNEGLLVRISNPSSPREWVNRNCYLYDLIAGKYEIKSLPWKAEETEQYYVPNIYDETKFTFPGAVLDLPTKPMNFYLRGLMCKTPEQAEELAQLLIKTAREFQGFDDEWEA